MMAGVATTCEEREGKRSLALACAALDAVRPRQAASRGSGGPLGTGRSSSVTE